MTVQFVSALELATYFNGTTDLAELTPEWIAQANILLEMISADVEAAAGVPIEAGAGTILLPGSWGRDLDLPAGNVRNVTAVTVNRVIQDPASYTFNDRQLLRRGAFDDYDFYPLTAQGARSRNGTPWGSPSATVAIELQWGYTTVPDFVKSLVLRIGARTFGNVANVTQESLAIYSVTYGANRSGDGSHVNDAERKRLRQMLNRTSGTIVPAGI